jgi:hypothetical protein
VLGFLADLIKTVSYGNEYLHCGGDYNWRTLRLGRNPIFKDGGFGSRVILARGIDGWYRYLKDNGCKCIRVFYKEVESSSTDKNGYYHGSIDIWKSAEWIIETVFEGYSDYWESKWFNKWGWNGDYFRISSNQPVVDKQKDMEKVRGNLENKLNAISSFAYESGYGFSEYFKNNINILNSRGDEPNPGNTLIVEKNYGQLERRVFNAAYASWCFNGMGSWVDFSYSSTEVNRKRDQLTKELFLAVCDAYMYVINSY